jgi:hypothetical protein
MKKNFFSSQGCLSSFFCGNLLFLLSTFTILSCGERRSPQRHTKGTTNQKSIDAEDKKENGGVNAAVINGLIEQGTQNSPGKKAENKKSSKENNSGSSKSKKLLGSVVLYHGLGHVPKSMENLKKELEQFGAKVYVSAVREGKTANLDIKAQASLVEKELRDKFAGDGAFLQNAQKNGLYHIGHSQGGFIVSLEAKNKKLHQDFKITKLGAVFLQSPAGGGFDGQTSQLKAFEDMAVKLGSSLPGINMKEVINKNLRKEIFPSGSAEPGVSGMARKEVAKGKYAEMGDVPFLAIASTCGAYRIIGDWMVDKINPMLIEGAKLIVPEAPFTNVLRSLIDGEENDGTVPISSQKGFKGSKGKVKEFKDISHIGMLNPQNSKTVAVSIVERFGSAA